VYQRSRLEIEIENTAGAPIVLQTGHSDQDAPHPSQTSKTAQAHTSRSPGDVSLIGFLPQTSSEFTAERENRPFCPKERTAFLARKKSSQTLKTFTPPQKTPGSFPFPYFW
jgi:hypothetical protein